MKNLVLEELVNTVTHGFGVFLSFIGLFFLLYYSITYGTTVNIVSSLVYGISLILLYSASTLLHGNLSKKNHAKVYNIIDHCAIYALIAGSYTPFLLISLKGVLGWTVLGIVWFMALAGMIYQIFLIGKYKIFSTITYIVMGWMILFVMKPLMNSLAFNGLLLLSIGGILYTIGSIFFVLDKKKRFNHAVWHVFVLLGSIFQYLCILFYVIPQK